jgi:hypothetical protein
MWPSSNTCTAVPSHRLRAWATVRGRYTRPEQAGLFDHENTTQESTYLFILYVALGQPVLELQRRSPLRVRLFAQLHEADLVDCNKA